VNLHDLGWDAFFADAFEPHGRQNRIPARVAARHHGPCELLTELGRLGGVPSGRLGEDELPAVGDWVAARPLEGERKAVIEASSSSPRSAATSTRAASSGTSPRRGTAAQTR
jgi:ribosome biogenesis GTPase